MDINVQKPVVIYQSHKNKPWVAGILLGVIGIGLLVFVLNFLKIINLSSQSKIADTNRLTVSPLFNTVEAGFQGEIIKIDKSYIYVKDQSKNTTDKFKLGQNAIFQNEGKVNVLTDTNINQLIPLGKLLIFLTERRDGEFKITRIATPPQVPK